MCFVLCATCILLLVCFSKSNESPRPNGKLLTNSESRINRPFKSPFAGGKGPTSSKAESSPFTPKPLCLRDDEQNKRMRSPIQSPLSSRIVKNGTVTSLQPNRLKRARLSTPSLDDLLQKETQLDREIAQLVSENLSVEELDHQIDLLHRYNDIKDVAQIVMGRLAELENVTVKSLHQKYGAPHCD